MSYTVNLNNKTVTVEYGALNTETSLELVGKDYFGYGEAIAQNFATLLENSAVKDDATGPANPVAGQLWYQKTAGNLKVYDGATWSGTDVSDKTVLADDGTTYHNVTIIEATGAPVGGVAGPVKPIAAFAKTAFTIHSTDAQFDSGTNGFPANKIEAGITLGTDLKMHGTATTAEYADLAELYTSDVAYESGTVVKIGGEAEVTQTTIEHCPEVFGIVSSNPAYLMNSGAEGLTVPVALEGRVPCKVIGEVRKGQRLVTSTEAGVARAIASYEKEVGMDWFRVVGRALENKDTLGVGLIEVVVGVK
jgi:hypothetical protein|tara:strand:- start:2603 stop:3520 length:918 start_codon:yes stop_codon:yes gene_type:complete